MKKKQKSVAEEVKKRLAEVREGLCMDDYNMKRDLDEIKADLREIERKLLDAGYAYPRGMKTLAQLDAEEKAPKLTLCDPVPLKQRPKRKVRKPKLIVKRCRTESREVLSAEGRAFMQERRLGDGDIREG